MIGYAVCAAGWVAVLVGVVLLFGAPAFVGWGLVTVAVGAFVDLDPEPRRPSRGKPR